MNVMAAPAWSLKRIKIIYEDDGEGFALISPKNREEFFEDLNQRRAALR